MSINIKNSGQSILEIIIAMGIMIIIVGSTVSALVGSFSVTRLGEEETKATLIASEGLSAVESIRNRSWGSLPDGNWGLENQSGIWQLSGTSDTDPTAKYTRVINIATIDNDRKNITSTVSWNFTPARQNQIVLTSSLTNWREAVGQTGSEVTPTPTPTPPPITSCPAYCVSIGLSGGTCRSRVNQCAANGQTYQSGGDLYCSSPNTRCCCSP